MGTAHAASAERASAVTERTPTSAERWSASAERTPTSAAEGMCAATASAEGVSAPTATMSTATAAAPCINRDGKTRNHEERQSSAAQGDHLAGHGTPLLQVCPRLAVYGGR
jgi:hypothetical protein